MPEDPSRRLDAHLFVCTHSRETGESCAARGGGELRDFLKKISKDEGLGWKGRVRINASGCLGYCQEGITAVLYPEGRWFKNLRPESGPELEKAVSDALALKANPKG